jgi:hypothetical protein
MDRIICIVSRQHPELFAYLQHRFKDSMVSVILDRRMTARRREALLNAEERRRDERRRRPDVDADLLHHSHVIVRLPGL